MGFGRCARFAPAALRPFGLSRLQRLKQSPLPLSQSPATSAGRAVGTRTSITTRHARSVRCEPRHRSNRLLADAVRIGGVRVSARLVVSNPASLVDAARWFHAELREHREAELDRRIDEIARAYMLRGPCKAGHPITMENTQRIGKAGYRCRECRRKITRESVRRMRAAIRIEARSDETAQRVQPVGREPGPKASPND